MFDQYLGMVNDGNPFCRLFLLRLLNQPDFVWPTLEEIKKVQQEVHSLCERTNSLDPSDGLYKIIDGKIWAPDRNVLRQRMCSSLTVE